MTTSLAAPANGNGALTKPADKIKSFQQYFEARKTAIASVIPKTLTAERVLKIAIAAVARTPKLLECNPQSVYSAVHSAGQLGLEAGSPLGHAYLVPFKSECQLIIGYRGLIDLARRSGQIVSIEAHVVREKDEYEIEFGIDPKLRHRPFLGGDAGKMVLVYAVAKLKDGGVQSEVMTKADVDAIRKRSRASDSGPWVTDYDEMARKTVVRRLCKYLPISIEAADVIANEEAIEAGNAPSQSVVEILSSEVAAPVEGASKADEIANRLTADATPALTNDAVQSGPTIEDLIGGAKWLTATQRKQAIEKAKQMQHSPTTVADILAAAGENESMTELMTMLGKA